MTSSTFTSLGIGNRIVDHLKNVTARSVQDSLTTIMSEPPSNGGYPYHILKDLALHGLLEAWPIDDCLRLNVSAAARSHSHPICSGALRSFADCRLLERSLGTHTLALS